MSDDDGNLTDGAGAGKLLEVRTETNEDVLTLTIEGELDLATAPQVREPLEAAISEGTRRVVIDMLGCGFIDSTGLGVLLRSAKQLDGEGGMAIVCVDEQITRLLELTMIDRTIPVFATRDDAVAHLTGAAA
ncbi:MAG: STAS domain-containing protein [Solirubrobacterales bacterium]